MRVECNVRRRDADPSLQVNKGPGWCRSPGSLVELVRDGVYLNRTVRPLDHGAGLSIDEKDHDARDNPSLKKKLWIMRILKLGTDVVEHRKGKKGLCN